MASNKSLFENISDSMPTLENVLTSHVALFASTTYSQTWPKSQSSTKIHALNAFEYIIEKIQRTSNAMIRSATITAPALTQRLRDVKAVTTKSAKAPIRYSNCSGSGIIAESTSDAFSISSSGISLGVEARHRWRQPTDGETTKKPGPGPSLLC